jgi:squalene-hopene/tetraprenyl-beta-curcumene cyclase
MKKGLICFFLLCVSTLFALSAATRERLTHASKQGYAWLRQNQSQDGSWSDRRFPGLSALALWSLALSKDEANLACAQKAADYIAACAQPDGGIYVPIPERRGSGLGNYNTCLCLRALHVFGQREKYLNVMLGARAYIASTQIEAEGMHEGGFGYDKTSPRTYTDMNNTFYAIDAMRMTQDLEESRPGGKRVDVNWAAAKQYVLSMQKTEGEDAGGFLYNRQVPREAAKGKGEQKTQLKAFGSMTYAGLLAMLHCELTQEDPRVRSTYRYLEKFWTLDENPGQGNQGLYFYYEVLARALTAAGVETLTLADGTIVDWREALAEALLARQQADGSWVNENNRFWEGDPALSTSYALLVLQILLQP